MNPLVVCTCSAITHEHAAEKCSNAPDVICPGCHEVFCAYCISLDKKSHQVVLCYRCRIEGEPHPAVAMALGTLEPATLTPTRHARHYNTNLNRKLGSRWLG